LNEQREFYCKRAVAATNNDGEFSQEIFLILAGIFPASNLWHQQKSLSKSFFNHGPTFA